MKRIEPLLVHLNIEQNDGVANEVNDFFVALFHFLFVVVSFARRHCKLLSDSILQCSFDILAPDSIHPLHPDLEFIWLLQVVIDRDLLFSECCYWLKARMHPSSEVIRSFIQDE